MSETPAERTARIAAAQSRGGAPLDLVREPTDAEIAEMRRVALLRLAESAARLSEDEKQLTHWLRVEDNARTALAAPDLPDAHREELTRSLAQSMVAQGRFHEAATYDPANRAAYERMGVALERADDEFCNCDDPLVPVFDRDGKPDGTRRMPRYAILARFYSPRHEQFVYLIECHYCKDSNATPMLPTALQDKLNAEAMYPKEGAGPDAQVFGE